MSPIVGGGTLSDRKNDQKNKDCVIIDNLMLVEVKLSFD